MAWIATDQDGKSYLYANKPYRNDEAKEWEDPKGLLPEILEFNLMDYFGRNPSWNEEPVELYIPF